MFPNHPCWFAIVPEDCRPVAYPCGNCRGRPVSPAAGLLVTCDRGGSAGVSAARFRSGGRMGCTAKGRAAGVDAPFTMAEGSSHRHIQVHATLHHTRHFTRAQSHCMPVLPLRSSPRTIKPGQVGNGRLQNTSSFSRLHGASCPLSGHRTSARPIGPSRPVSPCGGPELPSIAAC